jgi:RNA polymerase sigma-70 factor (ECF subfamily)
MGMSVALGDSARGAGYCPWAMAGPGDKLLPGVAPAAVPKDRSPDPVAGALSDLMESYSRGDDAALAELYRLGAPRLRGFLTRLGGDSTLADDLTQDTFLRIHRARGSFAAGAAALPWMIAIARNAFLDHSRRLVVRRKEHGDPSATASAEPPAPPSTRGDEALAAREMLDVVQATLAHLPALQRDAFVLIRFEGLSVAEAAQVLGTTEGAVKVRAFRAYEALRAALDRSSGVKESR